MDRLKQRLPITYMENNIINDNEEMNQYWGTKEMLYQIYLTEMRHN